MHFPEQTLDLLVVAPHPDDAEISVGGTILWEDTGDAVRELGSLDLKTDSTETLSAPAFTGTRCHVRIGQELICLELQETRLKD